MKLIIFSMSAALSLVACGDAVQQAEDLRNATEAAIDEQGLANSFRSAVNEDAVKGLVTGAAKEALGDAIPPEAMSAAGAVIDEEALAKGVDKAVDGQALKGAVQDTLKDANPPARPDPQ
jgi:hypothetical protein